MVEEGVGCVNDSAASPAPAADVSWHHALVFVYGTLKRQQPNHGVLSEPLCGRSAPLAGSARTVRRFPLVVAGAYSIPYCLDRPGEGNRVCGELYHVDRFMLDSLDVLEGYPHHYTRREEEIELIEKEGESGRRVLAWIYLLSSFSDDLLSLPLLTSYSAHSPDQPSYVPPSERA